MCGICGFFGGAAAISDATLTRMNDTLARRGPDDQGQICEPEFGLAMRRLSIIDLQAGHQPIENEDGSIIVVFNGEIYNYRELRTFLTGRGHRFNTQTDTEVIVHLYEDFGDELVHHLRGMFAFALWDKRRCRGLLVRDRLGIKPLFFSEYRGAVLFGSEIKALLASGVVERELDYQAVAAFFTFTYIPAPLSIYAAIRKLEPGYMLTFESGRLQYRRYWDIDFADNEEVASNGEWQDAFDTAIDEAVASHLVSDVPIGAFLSGGVDSSLVVSLMSHHVLQPIQTFTMGFGGRQNPLIDERPLAKLVAEKYGCDFHEYTVNPHFRDIVGEIVCAFDEPFADDSVIPTYYLSQLTRQRVKVALSGLGGDELFAGYERYSGVLWGQIYSRYIPWSLHRYFIDPIVQGWPERQYNGHRVSHAKRFLRSAMEPPPQRYLGYVSTLRAAERELFFSPDAKAKIDFAGTDALVTDLYERCESSDEVNRALYVDLKTYLPEDILALSDRLSMWHSLEVRVPLVDHRLVELSARLPVGLKISPSSKKVLLKLLAKRRIPSQVIEHRKQGFEAPMATWLKSDLSEYSREMLSGTRLKKSGLFDDRFVSKALDDHLRGRRRNNKFLFSLIMFQEWYERCF